MPRNCGCSGGCDCVIIPGSGADVTGSGRPADPYVVSLDAGGGGGGGGFDPGDLKWTARPSAPVGWLVCDGAAVSRSTYADLFEAIGTLHGAGDGTTTFNLPDYTGRFMLGADGSHALGSAGGAEQRTLTATQMPVHDHANDHDHPAVTSGSDTHAHATRSSPNPAPDSGGTTLAFDRGSGSNIITGGGMVEADTHNHSVDLPPYVGRTGSTGGGQPFSIMPPYGTALPLIKT